MVFPGARVGRCAVLLIGVARLVSCLPRALAALDSRRHASTPAPRAPQKGQCTHCSYQLTLLQTHLRTFACADFSPDELKALWKESVDRQSEKVKDNFLVSTFKKYGALPLCRSAS